MMGSSTNLNSEHKNAKRDQLDRRKKKRFGKFKVLTEVLVGVTLVLSLAATTSKCSDSPTDNNPTTQTDTGSKSDVGELKDVGTKDAGQKDAETGDVQSEDVSDGGSPKDVETPDEDKADVGPIDVGPTDAGAEVETTDASDAGQINDGGNDVGPVADGGDTELNDVPQPVDGGEITDGPQQTDGGDDYADAGVKVMCDEYLGNNIPEWANEKIPLDMFIKYFSGVTGFAEKIDALKDYITDINGEVVVLLGKINDPTLPSGVKIIYADILFGVAGVEKPDGTKYDGLCKQSMNVSELNAAYQDMMSGTGN